LLSSSGFLSTELTNTLLLATKPATATTMEADGVPDLDPLGFQKVERLDWAFSPPRRLPHGTWGDEVPAIVV